MTIRLIGNKKTRSTISLTKSTVIPNYLYLLTNPLLNKRMQVEATCDGGNIDILFDRNFDRNKRIKTSTSTYISTASSTTSTTFSFSNDKKYKKTINKINKSIQKEDSGYIIPLHIDDKIKDLHELIQNHNIDQYPLYKYYKLNNNKNNIIYQYIDNELYILTLVIKNFFDISEKELLFNNITKNINIISNNFKNKLKEIYNKKKNQNIIQGATDPYKNDNDCLYSFCVIVVFGNFEGGNLILSEIGVVIRIEGGYIIFLRSALLEHYNSYVTKGNRFSIVFYLRKTIFNEK